MLITSTHLSGIVGQHPWEDWVLHEVIVGSPCQCVEVHQVLEVGNLSILQECSHTITPYMQDSS